MTKFTLASLMFVALAALAYSETKDEKKVEPAKSADSAVSKSTKETSTAATAKDTKAKDAKTAKKKDAKEEDPEKVDWKNVDWGKRLTKLQYYITREAGTERPFHNEYWNNFKDGSYKCVSCGLPLFESTSKFDAGCGWPSFDKTLAKDAVTEHVDHKLGYPRTEVRCKRCGAHLGHVFDDGPTDTKLRYCMNSAALKFVPDKDAVTKETKDSKKEKKEASATDKPVEKKADAKPAEATKTTEKADEKK